MKLINNLGRKKDNKGKTRNFGIFYCSYCDSEVERRMDSGRKQESCGCMKQVWNNYTFTEWTCIQCGTLKPITEYYFRNDSQTYRKECKECTGNNRIAQKYGKDVDWYIQKFEEQDGVCEICGKENQHKNMNRLVIDHNHTTGEVRGLLCNHCNTMLGHAKENTNTLLNGIKYLNKYDEDMV